MKSTLARNGQKGRPVASLTVENYVKAIFQVCGEEGGSAATGRLAMALGVSPGTVTSMLKTLSESDLATYTPYEGVSLTPSGNALALRVVRRHRLIELFLVNTLDMAWDEVHEEAEHMEHAVSDRLIDRIDEFLGRPQFDPHGDPIPQADGTVVSYSSRSLAACEADNNFRLVRVMDQSSEFLRYLSSSGLLLGTCGKVVANRVEAGVVTIEVNSRQIALGRDVALKIMVDEP